MVVGLLPSDKEEYLAQSRTLTPNGTPYQNLCIGCDRFHEQVLGPVLEAARARRLAAKAEAPPASAVRDVHVESAGKPN